MTSSTSAVREPTRIVTALRQREGAGFIVRRPVPTPGLDVVDPFLLLDEMGPADYGPGEAVGAPDHPHRGFETITYMLEGEFDHEDSAGHRGVLRPGDGVQPSSFAKRVTNARTPRRYGTTVSSAPCSSRNETGCDGRHGSSAR